MIEYEKFYDIAEFIAKKEGTEKDLKNTATTAFKLLNNYETSTKGYGPSKVINDLLVYLEKLVLDGDKEAAGFYDEFTTDLVYSLEKKIKKTRGDAFPFDFKPENITFRKDFFSPLDCIEEDPNILIDNCLSANEYFLFLKTHSNENIDELTLDEFKEKYPDVIMYSLTQVDYIVKKHLNTVLVRFPIKGKDKQYDYRLCECSDGKN